MVTATTREELASAYWAREDARVAGGSEQAEAAFMDAYQNAPKEVRDWLDKEGMGRYAEPQWSCVSTPEEEAQRGGYVLECEDGGRAFISTE